MYWVERTRDAGIIAALVWGGACAALAGSLLSTVTRLRMAELRDSLQSASEKHADLRDVALLSRVALINRRALAGGYEDAAQYRQEAENALIAIRQSAGSGGELDLADRLALPFLNGMNRVLGLPHLRLGKTPPQEMVLDLAFRYESFREYEKAVRGYSVYLTEYAPNGGEKDLALLHRGFCHAMRNHFDSALADFAAVETSPSERNAATARSLGRFIREIGGRVRAIESVADPARRGELYYEAAVYAKAVQEFSRLPENRRTAGVRFMTARSLEETGEIRQALTIYRDLVRSARATPYALKANRRMYLLGAFLGDDQKLAEESRMNSQGAVPDREFIAAFEHLEKPAQLLRAQAAVRQAAEKPEIAAVERLVLPQNAVATAQTEPAQISPQGPPKAKAGQDEVKATVVDLRNVSAAQRAESLSVREKEELLRGQKAKIDKLTMIDGNIFFGVAFREDQSSVWLFTVLGNLQLDKAEIRLREKVTGSAAIQ